MDWFKIAQFVQEYYVFPILVSIFLIFILIRFILNYFIPAHVLSNKLSKLTDELDSLDGSSNIDKDLLDASFEDTLYLKQAWLNYKKTFQVWKVFLLVLAAAASPPKPSKKSLIDFL